MNDENRGLKIAVLWLLVLNLLAGSTLIALADAFPKANRTPAEKELDALVQMHESTRNLSNYWGTWERMPWYDEWLQQYELSGTYVYGWRDNDWNQEQEQLLSDLALAYWQETCGITPTNDLSMASEWIPVQHTDGENIRYLLLVERVHDDRMPSFYVLLDRNSGEILSSSDVNAYKLRHAEVMAEVEKEREAEDKLRQVAVDAVMKKYGDRLTWLNEEYIQSATIFAYPAEEVGADQFIRRVKIQPPDGFMEEFTVDASPDGENIYAVTWYPDAYGRYTDEQKQDALDAIDFLEDEYMLLLEKYESAYRIPMNEKADFYNKCKQILDINDRWDFLFLLPMLGTSNFLDKPIVFPETNDLSEEAAKDLVIQQLKKEFFLTDAQAQALTWYSELNEEIIPGVRTWRFWMDLGKETVFSAWIDAKSGMIHDVFKHGRSNTDSSYRSTELITALDARYGNWGEWPIEIKARYGHIYLSNDNDFGLPGAEHIGEVEALELAKKALLNAYPELTRDQLDAARICPYFTVKPHMLYGVEYDPGIYYFTFDVDWNYISYEVILDGVTGEIYLTHDPSTSGNG